MGDVLILCYHGVSQTWPAEISVAPEAFERQLDEVARRGYRGVTFSEAVLSPPSRRVVAITFDDAYRSVRELAAPILTRLGFPATVFVPTGFAGHERPVRWPGVEEWLDGPHEHELIPMSWQELGELAEQGWEIGSHTRTHPRLPELEGDALHEELAGSRLECEARMGHPCRSLAYPYGDHDARVAAAAASAGYVAACGVRPAGDVRDPLRRARVGVYRSDDTRRFRRKVSPAIQRLRASRAWALVRRGRALVGGRHLR